MSGATRKLCYRRSVRLGKVHNNMKTKVNITKRQTLEKANFKLQMENVSFENLHSQGHNKMSRSGSH